MKNVVFNVTNSSPIQLNIKRDFNHFLVLLFLEMCDTAKNATIRKT